MLQFQKHLDLETLHLISTLGWANHLAFQGKLDIRNPRIEQLRYKVKNPVAKKLKTMDSFSQPFAGCLTKTIQKTGDFVWIM